MTRRRVAVCGSTGSIGTQTLDVVAAQPDRFEIVALGAGPARPIWWSSRPSTTGAPVVALTDPAAAEGVAERLPSGTELLVGTDAIVDSIGGADVVVNGVVGFAGLGVTMAALEQGKRLALANKESLIAAGPVVQAARATPGAELVPVDSEHGALHQCLRGADGVLESRPAARADRLGRPVPRPVGRVPRFGDRRGSAGPPDVEHGPKITVDSSTLMNKGLEVIEAHELYGASAGEHGFGVGLDAIDVVVHPQSIVHSMVEYTDGSTIAQLSMPDMRLPHRLRAGVSRSPRRAVRCHRLDRRGPVGLRAPRPRGVSLSRSVSRRAGSEGRRRRGSTPPTRWRSRRSSPAESGGSTSRRVLSTVLDGHDGGVPLTVHDVVDADESARRRAADVIAAW